MRDGDFGYDQGGELRGRRGSYREVGRSCKEVVGPYGGCGTDSLGVGSGSEPTSQCSSLVGESSGSSGVQG